MNKNRFVFHYKLLVMCVVTLSMAVGLFAAPDVLVDLRLYEGAREKKSEKPSVVTSYYLQPIFSGSIVLDIDISQEKKEIQKVFNLSDIKLTSQANWGWKRGVSEKQFQLIVLNGHKFVVQLTLKEEADQFELEVIEKEGSEKKYVLETDILLTQGKTVVFGFEDSIGKPFFLSFQRHKDTPGNPGDSPLHIEQILKPKLIKKVKPVYPKEALEAGIQGNVMLDAVTDVYGRVAVIDKVSGHPLLNQAAIAALKQWVYEPFILDKKPKAVKFTVIVTFNLNSKEEILEDGENTSDSPLKLTSPDKPILVKKVPPQYPKEALKEKIQGRVIVEAVVDVNGNVEKIMEVSGHPLLADAAIDAVKQWKYKPYIVKGRAKVIKFTVTVNFNLDKKKEK